MRLRTFFITAALAVVGSTAVEAKPVRVCIHDQVFLSAPARATLRAELSLLFPRLELITKVNPCSGTDSGQVVIFVKDAAPGEVQDALGRAPVVDGRILPTIEVFVDPIVRLTGANDFETLGRALGRVAGHELLHYLLQQQEHSETGLLRAQLSAEPLLAENRRDLSSRLKRR